jgi:hypothetical protein
MAKKTAPEKPVALKKADTPGKTGARENVISNSKPNLVRFREFTPSLIRMIRSSVNLMPRDENADSEYKYSCILTRDDDGDEYYVGIVQYSASEVFDGNPTIEINATYIFAINTPKGARAAEKDVFMKYYVRNVVWQRFRDFCCLALAQAERSIPSLPIVIDKVSIESPVE